MCKYITHTHTHTQTNIVSLCIQYVFMYLYLYIILIDNATFSLFLSFPPTLRYQIASQHKVQLLSRSNITLIVSPLPPPNILFFFFEATGKNEDK